MINENKELIITTTEAMMVLRVINKLNMKNELVKVIGEFTKIQQQSEQQYRKLRELILEDCGGKDEYINLSDDDKEIVSNKILLKDNGIQEKLVELEEKQNSLGTDILYEFISKLPSAEKEVYKALATIFNKSVKEIEVQELDKTVDMIKEIVKCKSIISFFK